MPAQALETAPVELEVKVPGGGGPGDLGPDGSGGGGGGGGDDDQRRTNLYKLGLTLGLISITTLFLAAAIIYYVRSRFPPFWLPIRPPRALWLSTGILGLSSLMMEWARGALAAHRWFVYRRRLLLTSFLGFSFIAAQLLALAQLVEQGLYVRANPHASVFYVFTGLHAVHLVAGMIVLNYLLLSRGRDWKRHCIASKMAAIYWHAMGLIWIGLFAVLALL